jgi:hypothetical protein
MSLLRALRNLFGNPTNKQPTARKAFYDQLYDPKEDPQQLDPSLPSQSQDIE